MLVARCQGCGGTEWTTRGLADDRGRCATCREFPTLGYLNAAFIESHCVVPDRAVAGRPFQLSDEQYAHTLHQHRLKPDASYDVDRPAAPFFYVGSLIVRSQKWGKGPFSAARIIDQAVGPVLFAGWADGGEAWGCSSIGCDCGWSYTYAAGEPMGTPWATPHIQVAAVAEDQTDNIWRALKPMIELGPLRQVIPDTGLDRINLPGGGVIEPVSANATTRLGARITYVEIDQPESMTKSNGCEKLVDTLLRNLAGMAGRWAATGNAHDPSEGSVQQGWVDNPGDDVYIDYPEPLAGSWANKRERRRILVHAYRGSPWVDVDRIESDCERLARKGDPGQAERFFGNRIVAGASKAFDIAIYKKLDRSGFILEPGRTVAAGFDGSLSDDHTGLVVTDVETMHQVVAGWWKRPDEEADNDAWRVPIEELDEAVEFVFSTWNVWRLYGDPPRYRDDMNRWAGRYGSERVVEWWTSDRKKTALALREYKSNMRPGALSHGPLRTSDAPATDIDLERHAALIEHVGNSVKRLTNMRDEDDEARPFLWLIGKESPQSKKKIDLAMSGCLSATAAGHARRKGVMDEETYSRAQWTGGKAAGGKVDRSTYLPCKGCQKPIHPRLHEPGAPERGRCMKCRAGAGTVTSASW